jgi:hypothetical protein
MKAAAAFLAVSLVALAQPPTPESVLGHKPGDDFFLATYDESLAYFQKLAAGERSGPAGAGREDDTGGGLADCDHLVAAEPREA